MIKGIFRSRSKSGKDVLTVASSNMADSTLITIVKEPTSPHHGATFYPSSHSMEQHNSQEFFANDFEKALYDDEETMIRSMLLLHASNCSSMSGAESGESHDDQTSLSCRDEYTTCPTSSEDLLEIQTIMEPSFEVALMESIAPDNFSNGSEYEGPEAPHTKPSNRAMSAEEVMMDLEKDLFATWLFQRKIRDEHDGRAFIHTYDHGLSALPESPSVLEETSPRASPSKRHRTIHQCCISENQKLQARWELAKHDFEQGGKVPEPLSPCRSPSHSRRARTWLKALL